MLDWWNSLEAQAERLGKALGRIGIIKMPPREKPNAHLDEFQKITDSASRQIAEAWDRYLETGDVAEWAATMQEVLTKGHQRAYTLGRSVGGSEVAEYEAEAIGKAIADLESYYLQGFANDLESGRYEGIDAQGLTRALSYTGRMRGTANGGFVDGSAADDEFFWKLGGAEDHCEDCPVFADASPYFKDTLPTTPGGNQTPCLFNCTCRLVRSDGATGFDPN